MRRRRGRNRRRLGEGGVGAGGPGGGGGRHGDAVKRVQPFRARALLASLEGGQQPQVPSLAFMTRSVPHEAGVLARKSAAHSSMVVGLLPSTFLKSAFETRLPLQYVGEPISQGSTAGGAGGGEAASAGGGEAASAGGGEAASSREGRGAGAGGGQGAASERRRRCSASSGTATRSVDDASTAAAAVS